MRATLEPRDRGCRRWQQSTRSRRNCPKMGLGSFRHPPAQSAPKPASLSAARPHRWPARLRHKILNNLHNQRNPWRLTPHKKCAPLSRIATHTPTRQQPSPQRLIYSMNTGRKIRQPRDGNTNRGSR